jgi:hypothetical protein
MELRRKDHPRVPGKGDIFVRDGALQVGLEGEEKFANRRHTPRQMAKALISRDLQRLQPL